MKIYKIHGDICELTNLQASPYDKYNLEARDEVNGAVLLGKTCAVRGCVRFFTNGGVRSKAMAEIEITVHGLPHRNMYVIYHDKKGFFSKIQKQKVYLNTLVKE